MKTTNTLSLICATAVMTVIAMSSCKKVADSKPDPKSVISITAQPAATTTFMVGNISGSLSVTASVTGDATLGYQWYDGGAASGTGGVAIVGETHASYTIPAALTAGTYHYFCEVTSPKAEPVRSAVAAVTVLEATARFTDGTTGGAHFEEAGGVYTITFSDAGKIVYGVKVGDFPDTEYLIGRKADEVVTLKLDEAGKLQFRDADADGNIPIGSYAEFAKIWGTGSGAETTANLAQRYLQEADLDMLGFVALDDGELTALGLARQNWTPIGTAVEGLSFIGSFYGGSHTLANLYCNRPTENYAGLFGNVSGGILWNIGIVSGAITGSSYVGSVCGYLSNWGAIEECRNKGIVTGTNDYVGGVCGENSSAIVTACTNEGIVMGAKSYVGGVCGSTTGRTYACCNMGNVTGGGTTTGGVCGYNNNFITACYNTGDVSGNNQVGGVCGTNAFSGILTSSYSIGTVRATGSGATVVGGVCGSQDSDAGNTVADCYFLQYPDGPNGVGNVGAGATSRTAAFGADEGAWPTTDLTGWALSTDRLNGNYWGSLGAWNGGGIPAGAASTFPRLWWEN